MYTCGAHTFPYADIQNETAVVEHDLDFYTLTTTCTQIDLLTLFHGGFSTGHGQT